MPPKSNKNNSRSSSSQLLPLPTPLSSASAADDDDDDFQIPPTQTQYTLSQKTPLKPLNNLRLRQPKKKPKLTPVATGKENVDPAALAPPHHEVTAYESDVEDYCSLDLIESSIDVRPDEKKEGGGCGGGGGGGGDLGVKKGGYSINSVEARLMRAKPCGVNDEEDEGCSELDVLIRLCEDEELRGGENQGGEGRAGYGDGGGEGCLIQCPLCGIDISDLSEECRQLHTNECLDRADAGMGCNDGGFQLLSRQVVDGSLNSPRKAVDGSSVLGWLRNLGLERFHEAFIREEIDWDTLQWLNEEDLFNIGVTALGPRKKIVLALNELRKGNDLGVERHGDAHASTPSVPQNTHGAEMGGEDINVGGNGNSKSTANKLITDYFPGSHPVRKKVCNNSYKQQGKEKRQPGSVHKRAARKPVRNGKLKDIPVWCSIPGTPFRVDAFKYLRGDCSHWFLTHFHMDHYQGLTKSFCHGKIYCSFITARLVNLKIGIPWDRLQVLPLNQKTNIAGVDVTCLDANHCPGSIIILFEPPTGKAVLHTGDFRFCEKMTTMAVLQNCPVHTLILDTTYCDPQYDFPKQEAVIQFVIEAIQAEAFNTKTLFLIGSYTIGKERLFLEVARVLRKKVYVNAAKFRLLECLGFSEEDMQWFTLNEHESHIHVVPMWTIASFKRLKHLSNQYAGRFSLIVTFSPTGWTFGKGKKKSPGRRWQQGTLIRYEVPYSEHSSFTELREFVKFVSPENIIPSVNNDGQDSADTMISLLLS